MQQAEFDTIWDTAADVGMYIVNHRELLTIWPSDSTVTPNGEGDQQTHWCIFVRWI